MYLNNLIKNVTIVKMENIAVFPQKQESDIGICVLVFGAIIIYLLNNMLLKLMMYFI